MGNNNNPQYRIGLWFLNRLYGSIDVYKNTTKDLLMLTSVLAYTGFSHTYDNIGQTSNKGIEFAVGADLVRSQDFNLSASINININKGNVDKLAEGVNGLYKTDWGSTMTQPNTGDYILLKESLLAWFGAIHMMDGIRWTILIMIMEYTP